LESLATVQGARLSVPQEDESAMHRPHILNVEVAFLPEVSDDHHAKFLWQVNSFWIIEQMFVRKDFEEFEPLARYQPFELALAGIFVLLKRTKPIGVEKPEVNARDGHVVVR
jgi:hypothetical protein